MKTDGLGGLHSGGDPHYAKCYDSNSPSPLNGIRFAFVSQIGTTNIDPSLPEMTPITNVSACMRTVSQRVLCVILISIMHVKLSTSAQTCRYAINFRIGEILRIGHIGKKMTH